MVKDIQKLCVKGKKYDNKDNKKKQNSNHHVMEVFLTSADTRGPFLLSVAW